jgi:hypothetical protein
VYKTVLVHGETGALFAAHIFEKGKHGLSLANPATSQVDLDAGAAKWIGLVEVCLQKRFAPNLPATPD